MSVQINEITITPNTVNVGDTILIQVDITALPLSFNETNITSWSQYEDITQWKDLDVDEFEPGKLTSTITFDNDIITKTSGVTGWDAEIISDLRLKAPCYVEFEIANKSKYFMLGLNSADANDSYTDIDFAAYVQSTSIYVYENGSSKGAVGGTYEIGDKIRIEVYNNEVKYYKNGILFYTSLNTPATSFIVDSSFYHVGASAKNIRFGNLREVRYIRDWLNGSTSNTGNHWVEIQAIDFEGNNIALNKTGTTSSNNWGALLTDGITTTSPYYSQSSGLKWVQVDLGQKYLLDKLKIWHYYSDGRTYHNTKTEVSSDGINWYAVFDSSLEGEYKETSTGHEIEL